MHEALPAVAAVSLPTTDATPIRVGDPRSAPSPWYARWAARYLNDARDVTFVGLILEAILLAGAGVALWLSPAPLLWAAPIYWLGAGAWALDRFTLMLHCTSHRPLFRPRHRAFNHVIPWFLGPFFGHAPNSYFAHHLGMHHREENLPEDLSTTLHYRRDRFDHWLRYCLRFLAFGLLELSLYFYRKRRFKLLARVWLGEGVYWSLIFGLLYLHPARTLVVFVVPLLAIRTLMMMGNWGQHAFVCAQHPEDAYRASITCINTRYNRRCFNDGYHVLHHLQPRCHWSDHPAEFERTLAEYGKHDSIVFDGIDFFQVWLLLMLRRWSTLASHFVALPGAPSRSPAQVIELLKSRVMPIAASA